MAYYHTYTASFAGLKVCYWVSIYDIYQHILTRHLNQHVSQSPFTHNKKYYSYEILKFIREFLHEVLFLFIIVGIDLMRQPNL